MSRGDPYHSAKLLHGKLMRLAERREREIARSNGAFQLDLMAAINGEPEWRVKMVSDALELDGANAYVRQALIEARAQSRSRENEPETERPPPIVVETQDQADALLGVGALRMPRAVLPSASSISDEDLAALRVVDLNPRPVDPGGPPAGHRYPEPGEAAITLENGEVVAAPEGADPWGFGVEEGAP